jgi:hypothetical protein
MAPDNQQTEVMYLLYQKDTETKICFSLQNKIE